MINGEILLLPKQELGYYNNIKNMNKKIFGLSIIEALVATVIVGIGFVAVLQMTSFAVTSIDTSGERTKANYIVSMIAEDIIGHRDSDTLTGNRLAEEIVVEGGFNGDITNCRPRAIVGGNADVNVDAGGEVSTIYGKVGTIADDDKAKIVKDRKWRSVFQDNNFIKCKSDQDVKTVRIFKICTWADCIYRNSNITDAGMYLGRVQININDGKKRKYLYFQADYKLKSFDFENGGGN